MNDRFFAKIYEKLMFPLEFIRIRDLRKSIIPSLKGNILEVGAGTGLNMGYYAKGSRLTLTDINNGMLNIAKKKAKELGIKASFFQMPAERLSFKDSQFDTVVATLVFCSVENPEKAFRELRRVCKNNGIIVLLEHVKSEDKFLAFSQKLVKPIFCRIAGCNPHRDTLRSIEKSGLKVLSVKNVWMKDIFKEIIIKNKKD